MTSSRQKDTVVVALLYLLDGITSVGAYMHVLARNLCLSAQENTTTYFCGGVGIIYYITSGGDDAY